MTDTPIEEALGEQPAQEPQEAPQEPPAAEEKPEVKPSEEGNITVPLAALHQERDARQKLAGEVEALKSQLQTPQAEPAEVPDPITDPEGYVRYNDERLSGLMQNIDQRLLTEKLNVSETYAAKNHGAQAVEDVKEWFQKQPQGFQQEALNQADPYGYAIEEQKRQTLTAQLTADPDKLDRVLKLLEGKEVGVPQSTATLPSAGPTNAPQWAGPTPLEEVFK